MPPFAQIECSTSGQQALEISLGVRQDRTIDRTVSFRIFSEMTDCASKKLGSLSLSLELSRLEYAPGIFLKSRMI